jgi:RNase H-like domain found in reverse transcriptase/Reverse transcriptase (RNA-dependent DNA polymerase)/Integrase zinc binding domain/Integrase core domain
VQYVKGIVDKRENFLIRPLQFIEFFNDNNEFLGLLDSGAQINVVSCDILQDMKHQAFSYAISEAQGVSGATLDIKGWATVPIQLRNGKDLEVEFAVVSGIKTTVLLGLPFLQQSRSILDHANLVLMMPEGPMQILEGKKMRRSGLLTITAASEEVLKTADEMISAILMPKLRDEEKSKVCDLLLRFKCLWEGKRRGVLKDIAHTIILSTTRPIKSRPRQFCLEHREAIAREIDQMLKDKVIRLSNSPYSSELVMVRKKTGDWRVCVDYRLINKHTVPDNYPFPRISDLLRSAKNCGYFVALDLRSGYWQIPMEETSKSPTAFRCPKGLYEFEVMPFGLTNAPATFQRAMDLLFSDQYNKGVSVFLDDILIFGNTFDAAYESLKEVLRRLERAGFTINLEKSNFFLPEIEYLGHVLAEGSIQPNQKRVEVLKHIKPASNVKEIRSILGMFGYYQSYIPKFSEILAPLTDTLKGTDVRSGKSIQWTEQMNQAVRKVGELLAEAILTVPVDSDELLVETDASDIAIAGVLNVKRNGKWEPIEFVSKKLSGPQLRWPIREKEAFAIVYSIQKFDPFLRTRPFTLHTDHQSLQWLQEAKMGKLARWASRIAEYDMTIYWKRGVELVHVDCLSRQVEWDDDLQDRMVCQVVVDPNPLPKLDIIISAQPTQLPPGRGFLRKDNVIYYRNGIWPSTEFRNRIIAACHSLPPNCHPGVKKTKSNVLKIFNWTGLHKDITEYVQGCLICQRSRPGLERLQGLIKAHPLPGVFQTIYLDFWCCRYRKEPRTVLTMIDQATKWVEAVPIPDRTAETVAAVFLQTWVCRFGVPRMIITDNDPPLVGDVLQRLAGQLGITKLRTTPYHPQGNAPIESFHRTLTRRFAYFETDTKRGQIPFETALQLILWSYRAVIHSTMGESPAFLVYGTDPRPPVDNDWRMIERLPEKERVKYLNMLREDTQFRAYQRLQYMHDQKQRLEVDIQPGDLVLLRQQPKELVGTSIRDETATKLIPRWSLPYRVLRQVYNNTSRFLVSNLLTGREREVHVTDIRAISGPQDIQQREEWGDIMDGEARKAFVDAEERGKALKRFWNEVDRPQAKRLRARSLRGDDERDSTLPNSLNENNTKSAPTAT